MNQTEKQRIIEIFYTWQERSGLTKKQILARVQQDEITNKIGESAFNNRFIRSNRLTSIEMDLILAVIKAVVNEPPANRCTAQEAIELAKLAGCLEETYQEIAKLFPNDNVGQIVQKYIPALQVRQVVAKNREQREQTEFETRHRVLLETYQNLKYRKNGLEITKTRKGPEFSAENQAELLRVDQELKEVEQQLKSLNLYLQTPQKLQLPVLPPKSEWIGREQELEIYGNQLKEDRVLALVGPPGIGKSALGRKLADNLVSDDKHIFWLELRPEQDYVEVILRNLAIFLSHLGNDEAWQMLAGQLNLIDSTSKDKIILNDKIQFVIAQLNKLPEFNIVICLDNYHHLFKSDTHSFLVEELIRRAKTYHLIFMGYDQGITWDKTNLHKVPPLSTEDTNNLIDKLFRNKLYEMEEFKNWAYFDEFNQKLLDLVNGNPQYITSLKAIIQATLPKENLDILLNKLTDFHKHDDIQKLYIHLWKILTTEETTILHTIATFLYVDSQLQAVSEEGLKVILSQKEIIGLDRYLTRLESSSLITKTTTDMSKSYKMHQTSANFFYEQYDLSVTNMLHIEIANFFDLESQPLEAARHFFVAKEYDSSFNVIQSNQKTILQTAQIASTLKLLSQFNRTAFNGNTNRWLETRLLRGEYHQFYGEYELAQTEFVHGLEEAEKVRDNTNKSNELTLCKIRLNRGLGVNYYYQGDFKISTMLLQQAKKKIDLLDESINKKIEETGIIVYWLTRTYVGLGNPDEAIEYADQCEMLFKEIENPLWQVQAYNNQAVIYFIQQNQQRGLETLENAEFLVKTRRLGNLPQVAELYNNLGTYHYLKENYDQSLFYYKKSLNIGKKLNIVYRQILAHQNLTNLYTKLCEWVKAEQSCEFVLRTAQETKDIYNQLRILRCQGYLRHLYRDWDEARETLRRVYTLAVQKNRSYDQFMALQFLGRTYRDEFVPQLLEEGNKYLKQAWEIRAQFSTPEFDSEMLGAWAEIEAKLGKPTALDHAKQSLEIAINNNNNYLIGSAEMALGSVYTILGELISAEENLIKAYEKLKTQRFKRGLVDYRLGLMYAEFKDQVKAQEQFKQAKAQFEKYKLQPFLKLVETQSIL